MGKQFSILAKVHVAHTLKLHVLNYWFEKDVQINKHGLIYVHPHGKNEEQV